MKNQKSKNLKIFFLATILFAVFGVVGSSQAADYYVNLEAVSNGNGLSADTPWNNLNSARKSQGLVNDGDTVYIWGTSDDYVTFYDVDRGSSDAYITYQARPGYSAHLNGSISNVIYLDEGTGYLIFDGIEISNGGRGIRLGGETIGNPDVDNIIIRNCNFHDGSGYGGIATGNTGCNNCQILNNTISSWGDNSGEHGMYISKGSGYLISGNEIYDNSGNGIQFNTRLPEGRIIENSIIEKNKIYNNGQSGAGNGIIIMDNYGSPDSVTNLTIKNNIIFSNMDDGIEIWRQETNYVYHNTIWSNGEDGITGMYSTDNVVVANNIVYQNIENSINGNFNLSNNLDSDPQFLSTNLSSDDFLKLSSLSTDAIDQGTDVGITEDYFGTSRPQGSGYDIGAHEYEYSDTTPPSHPTGLSVE